MKYRYKGPFSGVTLIVDGKSIEKILNPNTVIDLPEDHAYTKTLHARGHLEPVPEPEIIEPKALARVKKEEVVNGS